MSHELKSLGQLGQMAMNNIQGRTVPTNQAIVNRCHREATDRGYVLSGCEVRLECAPSVQNNQTAIVHVRLAFRYLSDTNAQGPVFVYEALGDADASTGGRVNGRYVALAETRAITRAAGLALNIDQEVLESNPTQAAPATYAPPMAGAAPAPAGGDLWMGPIPFGNNKGKMLNDPTVAVSDLQWMSNNLKLIDKVTPDTFKRNGCLAEIARRQGGAVATVPAQGVAQPLAPMPAFAPQPLPAPTGLPAFPAPGNPNTPASEPVPALAGTPTEGLPGLHPLPGQTVDPLTVNRLVNLALQRGLTVTQFQGYVQEHFGVADAGLLSPDKAESLEVALRFN
jgi:hypothetical protein